MKKQSLLAFLCLSFFAIQALGVVFSVYLVIPTSISSESEVKDFEEARLENEFSGKLDFNWSGNDLPRGQK